MKSRKKIKGYNIREMEMSLSHKPIYNKELQKICLKISVFYLGIKRKMWYNRLKLRGSNYENF